MPLPEAAQRKVDKAAELMRGSTPSAAELENAKQALAAKEAELAQAKTALQAAEHRAAVLKGKYDSEVPALNAKVKTTEAELKRLTEAAKKVQAGEVTSLSEEERELLGEKMIPAYAKIAAEVVTRLVGEQIKPLNERIDLFQSQTEAAYFATLDAGLPPEWDKTLNSDPKLLTWLAEVDPRSKQLRKALLQRAEAGYQGHLVVEILKAFLEGREIGAHAPAPPPKVPSVSPPEGGAQPLPQPQPEKKIYTRAEIAHFYRVKRSAPEYQGEEGQKLARAIDVDIAAASKEGRIQG